MCTNPQGPLLDYSFLGIIISFFQKFKKYMRTYQELPVYKKGRWNFSCIFLFQGRTRIYVSSLVFSLSSPRHSYWSSLYYWVLVLFFHNKQTRIYWSSLWLSLYRFCNTQQRETSRKETLIRRQRETTRRATTLKIWRRFWRHSTHGWRRPYNFRKFEKFWGSGTKV